MYLLLNIITVLLLLINKNFALPFVLFTIFYIVMTSRGGYFEKFIPVLVYVSMFYNIYFFEEISFMEVTLILYILTGLLIIILKNYKINLYLIIISMTSITFLLFGVVLSLDSVETLRNVYKLILLILNITVTFTIVTNMPNFRQADKKIKKYLDMYVISTLSLSVGVIFQFIAHKYFGTELGHIFSYASERTIYNLYFYPKSVLSGFICSGAIIIIIRLYKNFELRNLVILLIMLSATVINTSRTGLVILILVFIIYILKHPFYILKNYKTFLTIFLLTIAFLFTIKRFQGTRNIELLDDNGRFDIVINSMNVILDNLLLGIGSSWDDLHSHGFTIEIHNFVFQYLLQMGIIVTTTVLLILLFVINRIKSLEFAFVILFICLIGLLYAYWHNSLYINCIFIIGLLCYRCNYKFL